MADIKPIRSPDDYEHALQELEGLWGSLAGTPEGDRLDVLATLIEAYESERYPFDHPDPVGAIKLRMEQQVLTIEELKSIAGPHIAEVLDGNRPLSLPMIRRLHDRLGIPAEILIQPTGAEAA